MIRLIAAASGVSCGTFARIQHCDERDSDALAIALSVLSVGSRGPRSTGLTAADLSVLLLVKVERVFKGGDFLASLLSACSISDELSSSYPRSVSVAPTDPRRRSGTSDPPSPTTGAASITLV